MGATEKQAQQLRDLARWLDEHPADGRYIVSASNGSFVYHLLRGEDAGDELAALAREYGGRWAKSVDALDNFTLTREVLPGVTYQLYTARENVCERVVVATEEVEVEEPDPEAVAALPKVKRTEVVEQVEWICPPSLLAS